MNPEAKHIALTRPKIIRAIQHYLDGQGLDRSGNTSIAAYFRRS